MKRKANKGKYEVEESEEKRRKGQAGAKPELEDGKRDEKRRAEEDGG